MSDILISEGNYNSVFYYKYLYSVFEVKSIIILIHMIEGKEGIKMIFFPFHILIITFILAKVLLLSFLKKSKNYGKKYLNVVLL